MTERNRDPERFWTIKGLKKRVVDLGGIGVYLWGRKQQEKIDDEEYEATRRTWLYQQPNNPGRHTFSGTPAEFREFKAMHPEWFLKGTWKKR